MARTAYSWPSYVRARGNIICSDVWLPLRCRKVDVDSMSEDQTRDHRQVKNGHRCVIVSLLRRRGGVEEGLALCSGAFPSGGISIGVRVVLHRTLLSSFCSCEFLLCRYCEASRFVSRSLPAVWKQSINAKNHVVSPSLSLPTRGRAGGGASEKGSFSSSPSVGVK